MLDAEQILVYIAKKISNNKHILAEKSHFPTTPKNKPFCQ